MYSPKLIIYANYPHSDASMKIINYRHGSYNLEKSPKTKVQAPPPTHKNIRHIQKKQLTQCQHFNAASFGKSLRKQRNI